MPRFVLAALAALLLAPAALAQSDDLRRVVLLNGDVYVGVVEDEAADPVVVRTTDGVTRTFARAEVELVAPLIRGRFFRTDPVQSRLFLAPTARTLGAGQVRGDLFYYYPSVTAGLGANVDFLATGFFFAADGGFLSPLLGVKARVVNAEGRQVAVGASAIVVGDGGSAGVGALPYAVATFGDETQAVSVGVGGLVGASGAGVDAANGVLYGFGYESQINNGVKLFVEGLGLVAFGDGGDDVGTGTLLLPGVRFFGDHFSFDVIGVVATDYEQVFAFAPVGARASYSF